MEQLRPDGPIEIGSSCSPTCGSPTLPKEAELGRSVYEAPDSDRDVVFASSSCDMSEATDTSTYPLPDDHGHLTKGVYYLIYDSDEEDDNVSKNRSYSAKSSSWDAQQIRSCVRPELVIAGTKWDDEKFQAFPQVNSAERFLASHTKTKNWGQLAFVRNFTKDGDESIPRRVSCYLASEVLAQIVTGYTFDNLWDKAEDMETYIRLAIWPRAMELDADRLRRRQPSAVVELAKVIPRAYSSGYNNDDFWGHAVYIALRFPAGLHPFTTPIVREMIARFRWFALTGNDMWTDEPEETANLKLAATWAGYHIGRHLIGRNAYHLPDEEVKKQFQQLDDMVWYVATKHKLIRGLFHDVVKANILFGADASKLHSEVTQVQWERFAGGCHVVEYTKPCMLPPPFRKPSIILEEMQAEQPKAEDRPWDDTKPFTTRFDTPPDMTPGQILGKDVILSDRLAESIVFVNKKLADCLVSHGGEEPIADNNPTPVIRVSADALLEQIEAVRFRTEDLGIDIMSIKQIVEDTKERIESIRDDYNEALEKRVVARCKTLIKEARDDIKADMAKNNEELVKTISFLFGIAPEREGRPARRPRLSIERPGSAKPEYTPEEEETEPLVAPFKVNRRKLSDNPLAKQHQMSHSPRPASFPRPGAGKFGRRLSNEERQPGSALKRARFE